jgi:hypothetical protein
LILERRLTFSAAMSLIWWTLSLALYLSAGLLMDWWQNGRIVNSTATAQKNASGDIANVKRLEIVFRNAKVTWEKTSVT